MNSEILATLFSNMDEGERAVLCSVEGDPSLTTRWPGIAWRKGSKCHLRPDCNNYAAVSSFRPNERGEWRRKKDQFGAMHLVMVDDIGTKIDTAVMARTRLIPTLLVETSPGNFQAVFKLTEPQRDIAEATALIDAMIVKLTGGGLDPGMSGVTRVFRLPVGVNGKPKHNGWQCRSALWFPNQTTSFEHLRAVFAPSVQHTTYVEPNDAVTVERKRGFNIILQAARELRIVKQSHRAWVDIRCPWIAEHSDRSDTGTAIALPARANGYMGGFRCHHGHCQGRGLAEFEGWLHDSLAARARATRGTFTGKPK